MSSRPSWLTSPITASRRVQLARRAAKRLFFEHLPMQEPLQLIAWLQRDDFEIVLRGSISRSRRGPCATGCRPPCRAAWLSDRRFIAGDQFQLGVDLASERDAHLVGIEEQQVGLAVVVEVGHPHAAQ